MEAVVISFAIIILSFAAGEGEDAGIS